MSQMTETEKKLLAKSTLVELWGGLWESHGNLKFNKDYKESFRKFSSLKEGYMIRRTDDNGVVKLVSVNLEDILNKSDECIDDQIWEFPKGRRNMNERDMECASREFQEESSIPAGSVEFLNKKPYEEIYVSYNHKRYRHMYFVAELRDSTYLKDDLFDTNNKVQKREIRSVQWFTYAETLGKIKKYNNKQRIEMFKRINSMVSYGDRLRGGTP
jgi:8-oxo-dGTP pyrophosphatase MutT (NUDIX family)